MRATIFFLQAAAMVSASAYDSLFPTDEPTVTSEPATGSLLSELDSYGSDLYKTCTLTGLERLDCPSPGNKWCGFTTAAPAAVLSDFSSLGSLALSWWSAHSSAAVSLASECPLGWWDAVMAVPNAERWLNDTIAFAGCYADAHPTTGSATEPTTGSLTTGLTATTRSGVTSSGPKATSTDMPNSVLGQTEGVEMWMVAGTGLAVAAANLV
ncbi:hypothetical protein QBC33DRAFT_559055 [Phialemonium atrogriseum]|uniref:DUF7735 domain-containing protein n=1 Tax=Phialemonium atrogriseum TaxID=1093897 RepID=A0AAJ0C4K8_9PEZI|nr:uncharacterized protein QBC33DRAFT_559055 [Phialemonium atrogriseum]KAK1767571.1 hypothetical protein QBC33DRAFT_559055 [Phialemonium atrogriseum]